MCFICRMSSYGCFLLRRPPLKSTRWENITFANVWEIDGWWYLVGKRTCTLAVSRIDTLATNTTALILCSFSLLFVCFQVLVAKIAASGKKIGLFFEVSVLFCNGILKIIIVLAKTYINKYSQGWIRDSWR